MISDHYYQAFKDNFHRTFQDYDRHEQDSEYRPKFGGFRPKFRGLPEGIYPNTCKNKLLIYVLVVSLHTISFAFFGILLWLLFINTRVVSWIFAVMGLIYVITVLTLIFYGRKKKVRLEKKYMNQAITRTNQIDDVKSNVEMKEWKNKDEKLLKGKYIIRHV